MTDLDKAREEYAALRAALAPRNHVTHHTDCGCFTIAADAIIAALEAENEALREFCYECKHLDGWAWCREMSLDEQREHDKRGERDHCHFTPSRWQRRQP